MQHDIRFTWKAGIIIGYICNCHELFIVVWHRININIFAGEIYWHLKKTVKKKIDVLLVKISIKNQLVGENFNLAEIKAASFVDSFIVLLCIIMFCSRYFDRMCVYWKLANLYIQNQLLRNWSHLIFGARLGANSDTKAIFPVFIGKNTKHKENAWICLVLQRFNCY